MKALSELGISPWPWRICFNARFGIVLFQGDRYITRNKKNACLIAAAPELYEALREAVIEVCSKYGCAGNMPEFKCCDKRVDCFVKKWRAALAKASGEPVNDLVNDRVNKEAK